MLNGGKKETEKEKKMNSFPEAPHPNINTNST